MLSIFIHAKVRRGPRNTFHFCLNVYMYFSLKHKGRNCCLAHIESWFHLGANLEIIPLNSQIGPLNPLSLSLTVSLHYCSVKHIKNALSSASYLLSIHMLKRQEVLTFIY